MLNHLDNTSGTRDVREAVDSNLAVVEGIEGCDDEVAAFASDCAICDEAVEGGVDLADHGRRLRMKSLAGVMISEHTWVKAGINSRLVNVGVAVPDSLSRMA